MSSFVVLFINGTFVLWSFSVLSSQSTKTHPGLLSASHWFYWVLWFGGTTRILPSVIYAGWLLLLTAFPDSRGKLPNFPKIKQLSLHLEEAFVGFVFVARIFCFSSSSQELNWVWVRCYLLININKRRLVLSVTAWTNQRKPLFRVTSRVNWSGCKVVWRLFVSTVMWDLLRWGRSYLGFNMKQVHPTPFSGLLVIK